MQFDMSRAWSEAISKTGANFGLLAIIGGVFFFVPSVLMFVAVPDMLGAMMQPGFDPENAAALFADVGPSFFGIYFLILLASWVGYIAMIALVSDGQKPTVGEAIMRGVKALPTLIAMTIMFFIAYLIIGFVVGLIVGLIIGLVAQASAGLGTLLAVIFGIGIFLGVIWLFGRLSMIMPLLGIEGVLNPITNIGRSWKMTAPAQKRLFLFFLVLFVVYIVVSLVVFMVIGLIMAAAGTPTAIGFISGVIGALVAIVLSCLLVAIYNQLSGTDTEVLSEAFE